LSPATFQRARKPEEISIRRAAILAAAAELFDAEGPEGAGLNAIAARAGFTKSNVYRYFESREAVLLRLFVSDFAAMVGELEENLAGLEPGDIDATARVAARAFLDHPRVCKMLGILSSVLERNVSEAGVIRLKTDMRDLTLRVAAALARAVPQLTAEDCGWAVGIVGAFVSGIWPIANPPPIVAGVLARPEFAVLQTTADRDLERMIAALFKGLTC
jgi:AcrR family transcriptional regulator